MGGSACSYMLLSMSVLQGGMTCDRGHLYHSSNRRIAINRMRAMRLEARYQENEALLCKTLRDNADSVRIA